MFSKKRVVFAIFASVFASIVGAAISLPGSLTFPMYRQNGSHFASYYEHGWPKIYRLRVTKKEGPQYYPPFIHESGWEFDSIKMDGDPYFDPNALLVDIICMIVFPFFFVLVFTLFYLRKHKRWNQILLRDILLFTLIAGSIVGFATYLVKRQTRLVEQVSSLEARKIIYVDIFKPHDLAVR